MTAMTDGAALRTTARSEAELLAGFTSREPMSAVDGLSNVPMERVTIDGERLVVKWLAKETDWIMRLSDDDTNRAVVLWESGLYDEIDAHVDHAVVGACRDDVTGRGGVLMRDLGEWFLPEGAAPITVEQHEAFVRAMAGMHAGFWGWRDELGLCTDETRLTFFSDARLDREAQQRGELTGVPAYVRPGWEQLSRLEPATTEAVLALVAQPGAWVAALAETPRTFIHTDWKGGNLGLLPSGRTVLVDWAFPGEGAGCTDLAWYLAVNCDRLPASKESTIELYRTSLEDLGVLTAGWFSRQLELALLGAFGMLGWSKTEDPVELSWWVDRVTPVARDLLR
jgi:hypothetical protein